MADNFSIDLKNLKITPQENKPITKSANDEIYITQLRDCFNAGYQMPQYCIDNNIKKPLFVGVDESQKIFLWEIYVQFKYYNDATISPQFAFSLPIAPKAVNFSIHAICGDLSFKNLSELSLENFDKIILLTNDILDLKNNNLIYLKDVCKYFFQKAYCDIPLLHFMQKHPRVKLIVTNFPIKPKTNPEFEKKCYWLAQIAQKLRTDKNGNVKTLMDKLGYSNAEVLRMITWPGATRNADGSVTMKDVDHPLVHVKNGIRRTAYQPEQFINRIYFFGTSGHYGLYAPDDKTIESHLQKMLNEKHLPYRVENRAGPFFNAQQNTFYNLNALNPEPGDIILVYFTDGLMPLDIPSFDVSKIFDSYDYAEFFADQTHLNENGNKILAEKYFNYLTENDFFKHTDFEYLPPSTYTSSLWYTAGKFLAGCQTFQLAGVGRLQAKVA